MTNPCTGGPIEQAWRLLAGEYGGTVRNARDGLGRIRLDDRELRQDVQAEVERRWLAADPGTLDVLGDRYAFLDALQQIYGFGFPEVDYHTHINPAWPIPSLEYS